MIQYIKDYLGAYLKTDSNRALKIANTKFLLRRLLKSTSDKEIKKELYLIMNELE